MHLNRQYTHDSCLLYTSDAADDTPCVDLGGRRIIKKPPPTPNKPESTPTIALNKRISIGLTKT